MLANIRSELMNQATQYKSLSKEYQVYESYIVTMLTNSLGFINESKIDTTDSIYKAWKTDETISLKEYLLYAISMRWVDITKLDLSGRYSDTEEVYEKLVEYILVHLQDDSSFNKRLYKYMLQDTSLTGK